MVDCAERVDQPHLVDRLARHVEELWVCKHYRKRLGSGNGDVEVVHAKGRRSFSSRDSATDQADLHESWTRCVESFWPPVLRHALGRSWT